jgi:hypothetical protein
MINLKHFANEHSGQPPSAKYSGKFELALVWRIGLLIAH